MTVVVRAGASAPSDLSDAAQADRRGPMRLAARRRVLDAAIACFTRSGFHGTSMHEICAAAGMSPGALYRYFPSKEAIIIAIVEEERSLRAKLVETLESAPTFVEGLVRMGQALFSGEMLMVYLELGPEIYAEAARNPALKSSFQEVEEEMNEALRRAFLAARARGEIDPTLDPEIVILFLNAIGDGLVLRNGFDRPANLEHAMPVFATLFARMLAPASPSAASPAAAPVPGAAHTDTTTP